MIVLMVLLLSGQAPAPEPGSPVWDVLPTAAQREAAYPARALRAGVSGGALVRCQATAAGTLSACEVVDETPEGWGFREAALQLTRHARVRQTTRSGGPVEGQTVWMPLVFGNFRISRLARPGPGPIVRPPDWVSSEGGPVRPILEGLGLRGRAEVRVRCRVSVEGRLQECVTISSTSDDPRWTQAAYTLVPFLRFRPQTVDGVATGDGVVTIPIRMAN